jgi:hypothetical protein
MRSCRRHPTACHRLHATLKSARTTRGPLDRARTEAPGHPPRMQPHLAPVVVLVQQLPVSFSQPLTPVASAAAILCGPLQAGAPPPPRRRRARWWRRVQSAAKAHNLGGALSNHSPALCDGGLVGGDASRAAEGAWHGAVAAWRVPGKPQAGWCGQSSSGTVRQRQAPRIDMT